MSIKLSAASEIIQHKIVEFYKKWEGEYLPPLIVLYGGINHMVIEPITWSTSVKEILINLREIVHEKDVMIAGIATEVYMKEIKNSTQEEALKEYKELGRLNEENAKDSVMIMLWERETKEQFFAVAEIEKPSNKIGQWIETIENIIGGNIPDFEVFR